MEEVHFADCSNRTQMPVEQQAIADQFRKLKNTLEDRTSMPRVTRQFFHPKCVYKDLRGRSHWTAQREADRGGAT